MNKKKKSLIAYVLACTLFLGIIGSLGQVANAYELTGAKWANSQVDDLTYNRTGSPSVNGIWNDAIYTWNQQAILPNFDSETSTDPDVEFMGVHLDYTDADGQATWYMDTSGTIYYAYAWINTYWTNSYSDEEARSVASHEIGHVFGLAHETGCVVMLDNTYDRYDVCGIFAPVQDDLDGINDIY